MNQQKLVVFAAPSGAGKTTLVRHLLKQVPDIMFSVSATTRKRRPKEIHGKDYYFISKQAFLHKIDSNQFLEWQEVYDGNYYGTLKSEIDRIWSLNKALVFDVDVKGALNIKKHYGDKALTVFVQPPSIESIKQRLTGRNTETNEAQQERVEKAFLELKYAPLFDKVVINDDLNTAKQEACEIVQRFLAAEVTATSLMR